MLVTNTANVTSNGTGTVSYFHQDHLGSVVALSNAAGTVVQSERRSFDPWGRVRNVDGAPSNGELPGGVNAATDRGYTLHEHLEGLALAHMNARLYDHTIGRFTSADPLVQEPADVQSYNRYAYVQNRPLRSSDPTGYNSIDMSLCGFCITVGGGPGSFGGAARGRPVRFVWRRIGCGRWQRRDAVAVLAHQRGPQLQQLDRARGHERVGQRELPWGDAGGGVRDTADPVIRAAAEASATSLVTWCVDTSMDWSTRPRSG